MNKNFVLSFSAQDKPGIVELISNTVSQASGNWSESAMSHLAGRFVGIVVIEISADKTDLLTQSINALADQGLVITLEKVADQEQDDTQYQALDIELTGHDRPGIVSEISAVLAKCGANVEDLSTHLESGSMSAELLFKADIHVTVKQGSDLDDLQEAIESIADDLMVDIHIDSE